MDDEANALRGNAAHAAPGLDSRLWPLFPVRGAEPNPGVITDDWILSQVVFDEEAEAPIPAAVLQIEDGPPSRRGCGSSESGTLAFLLILLLIRRRLNLGPLHGISMTSSSEVAHRLHRLISIVATSIRASLFRLEILIFNPVLMLIGDLNLPTFPD